MAQHVKLFRSKQNRQWYFHLVAGNGRVTSSSEGYQRRASARDAARRSHPHTEIREPEGRVSSAPSFLPRD